jgi:MFS family permease
MRSTSTDRKVLQAVLAGGIVAVLVAIATNVSTGVLPSSWHPYLWLAWPALGLLVVIELLLTATVYRADRNSAGQVNTERAMFSRRSLLSAVRGIWVDEVLAHSVHRQVIIELGFEHRPDLLRNPWDLLVERPGQQPRPLEPDTTVGDLLQRHRSLLILGAPGAGKTTVLLNLLEHLLTDAEQDAAVPIPVVFQLNTWASSRKPLAEWLVDELRKLYGVPHALAQYWITEERVLPLLDGLDEVALDQRLNCARAIDDFNTEHRLLPLVVTSRIADYDSLGLRMALGAALLVQPLTDPQVEGYLDKWGEPLTGLRKALRSDRVMRELLRTPFLLSVAVRVYEGLPAADFRTGGGSLEDCRTRLLAAFVEHTLDRKPSQRTYESQDTVRWLAYIARALGQSLETIYHVEFVDDSWLPETRLLTVLVVSLSTGILSGITVGLLMDLLFGIWSGLAVGAFSGLTTAYLTMFIRRYIGTSLPHFESKDHRKELARRLGRWGGSTLVAILLFGILGGIFGLILGAIVGAATSVSILGTLAEGGAIGSTSGALIALPVITALVPMVTDVGPRDRKELRERPTGADLHDTVWFSCALAVAFGVPAIWAFGVAYGTAGFVLGAMIAFTAGYQYSGSALLSYWLTRLLLVRSGLTPPRQVAFLDFAVTRMLLYKVGGGYMFAHRLLLEYFAQLKPASSGDQYWQGGGYIFAHMLLFKCFPASLKTFLVPYFLLDGGLSAIDLRPEALLASALVDARDGVHERMIRKLTYTGTFLPAAQWAPVAMRAAAILTRKLPGEMPNNLRTLNGVYSVYRLVISAGHRELSSAAAFNLGELLNKYPNFKGREEILDAYQVAAASRHPWYAELAKARLANLDFSDTRPPYNQIVVLAYELSRIPALPPAPGRAALLPGRID